jgi:NADPH:quinone reductase
MRAVQITRFGGPEVLDVVDLPDPEPGPGEQLFEVSAAGINYADTHHRESCEVRRDWTTGDASVW